MGAQKLTDSKKKFTKDIIWNLFSVIILGVSGVMLNIIIGHFYGPNVLGVFNIVLALYIFISQFAAFGIWFSVLKYISEYLDDFNMRSSIISSAITITIISSLLVTIISYFMRDKIGSIFHSYDIVVGWTYVLPGFFCYSINKIFMAILNGVRDMKAYSICQACRYIMMIIFLSLFSINNVNAAYIPVVIGLPEIPLIIFLAVYSKRYYAFTIDKKCREFIRIHLKFGMKSCVSGAIGELNTRVDILFLGYFCNESVVGIFSMASMLAEGLGQLSVILRDNLNPVVTQLFVQQKTAELEAKVKSFSRGFSLVMIPLLILAAIFYPLFIKYIIIDPLFSDGLMPFIILLSGMALASGLLPFSMILVQAGFPGVHTLHKVLVLSSNFVLNLCLVPSFGMYGAAAATALAYVGYVFYLKFLCKRYLRIHI